MSMAGNAASSGPRRSSLAGVERPGHEWEIVADLTFALKVAGGHRPAPVALLTTKEARRTLEATRQPASYLPDMLSMRSHWFAVIAVVIGALGGTPAGAQAIVTLAAADQPLIARTQPLFSVGRAEGRDWEVFGSIGGVAFDADENLYVLDRQNARISVFDSAGRHVRTFGRRGGGPGEFGRPLSMAVLPDGQVVVSDVTRSSFSIFGRDGSFRRTEPFAQGSLVVGSRLAAHPRGGVVSRAIGNPGSAEPAALGDETLLWHRLAAGSATTIYTIRTSRYRAGSTSRAPGAQRPVFSPDTRFALLSGGSVAIVTEETYTIRIADPQGRVSRVLRRNIPPRRVTATDREHELERRAATYARPGGLVVVGAGGELPAGVRAEMAAALQNVQFASVMPVINDMRADAHGNLWVERAGPSLDRSGPIDLISPDGRYVGTLTGLALPDAFSRRGRMAQVRKNALGVEEVVVHRLTVLKS
jgi:6-bladed beta-propeller